MTRTTFYLAACAALIAAAICYTLPTISVLPSLFYDPIARRFFTGDRGGPIPMGYYGQLLWGVAGALVAGGITAAAAGRRQPADATVALLAAWTLTALGLAAAYFTWNNWP